MNRAPTIRAVLLLALLTACSVSPPPPFGFVAEPKLAEGFDAHLRRAAYVYPFLDPNGVDVLDDFPKDHPHHRGISWMWPEVSAGGRRFDHWHLKGIVPRVDRVEPLSDRGDPSGRGFVAHTSWVAGDEVIVRETATIRWREARRILNLVVGGPKECGAVVGTLLDVELSLEAASVPVTLGGQPADGKGYGGFGVRLAPHRDQVITTPEGTIAGDLLHRRFPWVDYSARFRGSDRISGVAVFVHPDNEGAPVEWILRQYGYIGECWPGLGKRILEPGRPLVRRYAILVHDGAADAAQVSRFAALLADSEGRSQP